MTYDILIRRASIVDGTGAEPYITDVGVYDDRIVAIGELSTASSRQVIEAEGRYLAPGFIDVHTHDDNSSIHQPTMLPKITQGITTVIVGNCGISASPVKLAGEVPDPMNLLGESDDFFATFEAFADAVETAQPAVNVAALIGHTTLRAGAMNRFDRPATEAEIDTMRESLRQALRAGAIGLSTGLAYTNARQATANEVKALVKVVGEEGGIYTTHMRNERETLFEAMDEAFETAAHGNVPLVISHLKCADVENWGKSEHAIEKLEQAAARQPCNCDCYPYSACSTTLDLWRVSDQFDILVTWSKPHPDMGRKLLKDIAAEWEVDMTEAARRLMPAGAIYHNMDEADVRRVLAHPLTMIGSDGLPSDPNPHPRLWGSFPRVIGHYCRDEGLFALPEAIRKMTSMSAARFGLTDRGVIREGAFADLTLFDYDSVLDGASFVEPATPAIGIEWVMVNGRVALTAGEVQQRSGRLLKREGVID
ncbi:N-acyl-D-amino-acid deacylase family protein [Salinicola avicenniae]|uniref:N-acyl-D-amino-acid deacylase family protein n=1 Tax=Salinicola avicenniae TaxID=2916836 RepID=UPI0020739BA5|nr:MULTISPECIES: D-aminoacylase [unclassified Salinicola]